MGEALLKQMLQMRVELVLFVACKISGLAGFMLRSAFFAPFLAGKKGDRLDLDTVCLLTMVSVFN